MNRGGDLTGTARAIRGALLVLWLMLVAVPTSPAPRPEQSGLIDYVSDYAGVLGSVDQHALESELTTIGKTAGYQLAVVLYPRLPGGVSASDTTELADKLLVGSSLEDRGLVLLVFVGQRLARLVGQWSRRNPNHRASPDGWVTLKLPGDDGCGGANRREAAAGIIGGGGEEMTRALMVTVGRGGWRGRSGSAEARGKDGRARVGSSPRRT